MQAIIFLYLFLRLHTRKGELQVLINSIKALTFKPIDFQSKKPSLLKTNYCDTFERSAICAATNPISFGMADDELLEKINASKSKREVLQHLMEKDKNLDEKAASACLVLNLTRRQREQFKLIAQNYPNLSPIQAALCAKAGFITKKDDEKIEQFEAIVTHPIKYTDDDNKEKQWEIPADEAILCVKENFDESQLKRYAQLRNRVVDLRDKTVRGTGKSHNLRPQYVLSAVKEGKTDEEIKQEKRMYKLIEKYGIDGLVAISSLLSLDNDSISDEDFFKQIEETYSSVVSSVEEIHSQELKLLSDIEDKVPEHLRYVHDYIYANCSTDSFTYSIPDSISNKPQEQTTQDLFDYINFMLESTGHSEYAEIYNPILEFSQKYNLAPDDASIFIFLPQELKNDIINGTTSANKILARYLPEDAKKIFLEAPKDEASQHKQALCKMYAFEKLYLDYSNIFIKNINEVMKEFFKQCSMPELAKSLELDDEDDIIGENENYAEFLTSVGFVILTEKDLYRMFEFVDQGLNSYQAYYIAKNTNATSITPEILEQIPDNVWYKIETGENKETHDTIQKAIKLCLNPPIEPDEHRVKVRDVQDLNLHSTLNRKGILEHNNSQFAVELQKTMVEKQPVLIVKDTNSDDKFVAYKGAIAYVAPLSIIDEEKMQQEMKPHCNLLPKKQAQILTRAIQEFVVDITDSDGGCVISKGLEGIISAGTTVTPDDIKPYTGAGKTTKETEEHYLRLVEELDKQGKFNAKNILRIFPEDAILSINPYAIKTDKSNILYSISAEWKDKEGKKWEMRIHSTDLSPASNATTADKWVFRLGYRIINIGASNERHFLQKLQNGAGYDFNGKFSGPDSKNSHIEFDSPLDSNNLLNNIDFQKDIRNISAAIFGENELDEICTDYDILTPEELKGNRGYFDKAAAVVKYAMENPIFYYWKQEYVNKLRTILKFPDLSAI